MRQARQPVPSIIANANAAGRALSAIEFMQILSRYMEVLDELPGLAKAQQTERGSR